jgi:hypothetical protein
LQTSDFVKAPISDERHFLGKILMKLAGIAHNATNGIPLFVLFLK